MGHTNNQVHDKLLDINDHVDHQFIKFTSPYDVRPKLIILNHASDWKFIGTNNEYHD